MQAAISTTPYQHQARVALAAPLADGRRTLPPTTGSSAAIDEIAHDAHDRRRRPRRASCSTCWRSASTSSSTSRPRCTSTSRRCEGGIPRLAHRPTVVDCPSLIPSECFDSFGVFVRGGPSTTHSDGRDADDRHRIITSPPPRERPRRRCAAARARQRVQTGEAMVLVARFRPCALQTSASSAARRRPPSASGPTCAAPAHGSTSCTSGSTGATSASSSCRRLRRWARGVAAQRSTRGPRVAGRLRQPLTITPS